MSSVRLTVFSEYWTVGRPGARGARIEVGEGGKDARFGADGRIEILADSVPFHSEAFAERAPKAGYGMLMVYGFRDTTEELHRARTLARTRGVEIAVLELEVDVGSRIVPGVIDRKLLRDEGEAIQLVNFQRLGASLQSQILQRFHSYAEDAGVEFDRSLPRRAQVGAHPEFFGRLFHDDRDFRHVSVFVVPVADDPEQPARVRQLAYVRPGIKILDVAQGAVDYTVVLPGWMLNDALAAKLRRSAGTKVIA